MGIQIKVLQKGKITIPIQTRNNLTIREGDTLTLEVKGGHLILLPPKTVQKPTDLLSGLAEGIIIKEPVKDELRKSAAKRLEKKSTRVPLMRFVDSKVFIYVLTRSPRESFEASREILKRVEDDEEAVTSTAVIHEIVDWLEYNGRRTEVKAFLTAVKSYASLHKSTILMGGYAFRSRLHGGEQCGLRRRLDPSYNEENNVNEIYSNDRDFDRLAWVKRIWE